MRRKRSITVGVLLLIAAAVYFANASWRATPPADAKARIIAHRGIHQIYDRAGLELINLVFSKILQDFSVVHIHPNNFSRPVKFRKFETPPLLEFTFLRNDRIAQQRPARTFPHPLDRKNVSSRPDLALPQCWYQPAS